MLMLVLAQWLVVKGGWCQRLYKFYFIHIYSRCRISTHPLSPKIGHLEHGDSRTDFFFFFCIDKLQEQVVVLDSWGWLNIRSMISFDTILNCQSNSTPKSISWDEDCLFLYNLYFSHIWNWCEISAHPLRPRIGYLGHRVSFYIALGKWRDQIVFFFTVEGDPISDQWYALNTILNLG